MHERSNIPQELYSRKWFKARNKLMLHELRKLEVDAPESFKLLKETGLPFYIGKSTVHGRFLIMDAATIAKILHGELEWSYEI